jgi:flagellar basal body rod protein FlgG
LNFFKNTINLHIKDFDCASHGTQFFFVRKINGQILYPKVIILTVNRNETINTQYGQTVELINRGVVVYEGRLKTGLNKSKI